MVEENQSAVLEQTSEISEIIAVETESPVEIFDPATLAPPPAEPPQFSRTALAWLSAMPKSPDTSDLFNLNVDNLAVKVVREILENHNFEFQLETTHPAAEWFNHFYFESKNRERVFGSKNFGFGYPFILAEIGGHQIAAPMFFWQLGLEPHPQYPDNWTISRQPHHQIVPNYPLFRLVDALHGTNFYQKIRKLAANRQMSTAILSEFSDGIRLLLGLEEQGLTLSILPMPSQNEANFYAKTGVIHWSGVLGIFPNVPISMANVAPGEVEILASEIKDWKHQFSALPLDPSQREVLKSAQENRLTVVEGASGSGKTYTISAIISNALSNGKKCLVVSHNLNALRRAQRFLLEKGFGDLSFVIRDTEADSLMLADMLRAAAENKTKHPFEAESFTTLLNKCRRDTQKLDEAWRTLHTPVFGEQSFRETVGRFMRANRTVGKELLLSQLQPSDFEFSKTEFDKITEAIRSSEPLFRKFPTLGHPLSKLQNHFFTENNPEKGLGLARAHTRMLLEKATALHHQFISKSSDYTESLTEIYSDHYAKLAILAKRVRENLEDGINRYGQDFASPASVTEKLASNFSSKYKEITAAKEKIAQDFDAMRKMHASRKYFDFDFPANFDLRNIPKIAEITESFDASLRLWRKRIPATVREDLRRLNQKSIHFGIDFKNEVHELETSLDTFLTDFNQTGLYLDEQKHEMLTVPKRQQFLESEIEKLEETQFYLRDFPDFYVWQKHWLSLDPASQKVVAALCKIKPKNWVAAFESWYLHHLLTGEFSEKLVWDDETLENLSKNHPELQRKLPFQIAAMWQKRKVEALKKMKSEDPESYKTWFGKNNRTLFASQPAENLFKKHLFALTETLPVLLVPPNVALDVMRNSDLKFDLILVDEGHNIMKQKGYHAFEMAKNIVLFGDSKQDMTPLADDDILEFCKKIGAKTLTLDYQHQHCPEEWIDFNKIAFETPFKRIPSNLSAHGVTAIENVGGRFDEISKTNEAEARQIINWLNLIEQTPQKTFPVVGIACATVQQRDLIAGQLLKIRQRKAAGHEKIQQLHLNGLGVYQFSELQGQHVDVLLVSLVHGLTDVSGGLTEDLDFWNTQLGINQLHIVLTRATERIYIAHSLPDGLGKALAADGSGAKSNDSSTGSLAGKNHRGTAILSNLVAFAELNEKGETEAAAELLENMKSKLDYPEEYYPSDIFMEEVEIALQPYFEPGRIQRNATIAGVTVPLLVQSQGESSFGDAHEPQHFSILLFDGVLAKTDTPSYEWEGRLQKYFQKHKIEYVPTLSVQWWKSPKQEARKLAGRIISKEGGTDN